MNTTCNAAMCCWSPRNNCTTSSGFRLGNLSEADQRALATLPPEQLPELPLVKNETDSLRLPNL